MKSATPLSGRGLLLMAILIGILPTQAFQNKPFFRTQIQRQHYASSLIQQQPHSNNTWALQQQPPPRTRLRTKSKLQHVAVFSLIKAMLGSGMFALPLGLAVITDFPGGLIPASAILIVLCLLSAYTFGLYGRLTAETQATSLGELWKEVMNDSTTTTDTSGIISWANFLFTFGCCLMYSLVLGDIFSSLVQSSRFSGRLPVWLLSRQASIVGVTTGILYPLCNLKSMESLAPMSILGVFSTLFTTAFLGFRCPAVVASSPYAAGGKFLGQATTAPSFGTYSRFFSLAPLILVSMSCIAMMGHFSAPEFYHSVATNKNSGTTTAADEKKQQLANFWQVTLLGFGVVCTINLLALTFGFLTFGGSCQGNILSNFSLADTGANVARLLVGISILGSFPMVMRPCQAAALEVMRKAPTDNNRQRAMRALMILSTAISLVVKDVGFVISMNGAVNGSSLIYTFPCLLFLKHSKNKTGKGVRLERLLCRGLVGFGLVAMIAGAGASIISTFYPSLIV